MRGLSLGVLMLLAVAEISLSSVAGKGTTVTVTWPIAEEHVHVEG